MPLYDFIFVEPGSENGKSNVSYVNLFDLFSAGYLYWGFLLICMQNLKAAWIISCTYFGFTVWL